MSFDQYLSSAGTDSKKNYSQRCTELHTGVTAKIFIIGRRVAIHLMSTAFASHRSYCFAQCACLLPAITGTHCTYPRRDGQAEWVTWVAFYHIHCACRSTKSRVRGHLRIYLGYFTPSDDESPSADSPTPPSLEVWTCNSCDLVTITNSTLSWGTDM